jgi:hypothetical protein
MFKLVAFLFLITAPEEPVHAMTYNQSAFPTEEACQAYLETTDGKAVIGTINMMGHMRGMIVKFACLEAKDNSI